MRLLLAWLFACAAVGLAAQNGSGPPPGGLLLGRVVDATDNTPIASVIVSLNSATLGRPISVLTDVQGRFLFRKVPKGAYTLRATTGGNGYAQGGFLLSSFGQIGPYLSGGFGQRRPAGPLQTIDLADGERVMDAVIRMWKGASIDGTVVDEAGDPLVHVVVAVARRGTDGQLLTGPSVTTDDRGAYHLGTLVPGDYIAVVPQMQVTMPLATSDAMTTEDRVLGARLANTLAPSMSGGVIVGTTAIGTSTYFNTSSVPPSPRGDALWVYQTTFASSATAAAQAAVITVHAGEERSGVNIAMQPTLARSVSGSLSDDAGAVANFGVRLMPPDAADGSGVIDVARTSTDANGRFTFPLVAKGAYRVIAARESTTAFSDGTGPPKSPDPTRTSDLPGAWAQQDIAVGDRDVTSVALQLTPGVRVAGHLEFRGSGDRPAANLMVRIAVVASRLAPLSRTFFNITSSGQVDANGEFVIRNMRPGRYTLFASDAVPGWSVETISAGGRVITDRGFAVDTSDVSDVVVELTDRPAQLTGTVHSRAGSLDPDAGVFLFPADRALWREARTSSRLFRAVRPSKAGAFSLLSAVPGDYLMAAIADESAADFPDVAFLTALATVARSVRIGAGEKAAVSLTTEPLPKAPGSPPTDSLRPADTASAGPHGPYVDEPSAEIASGVVASVLTGLRAAAGPALGGQVVTEEMPARPIRHAIVTATGAEIASPRQAITDDDGRFGFADLPPGRYSLVADKPGYLKTYYGSKRLGHPPGVPVAVLAGQPPASVVIHVPRGGVIAGVIRDPQGGPVASAQVVVRQPIVVNGERRFIDAPVPRATTDEKGRYRIYGLAPGNFVVFCAGASASYNGLRETNSADIDAVLRELRAGPSQQAPPPADSRTILMRGGYFPGTSDAAGAQVITLAAGEERIGVDIGTTLLRSMRVDGIALGPNGAPMSNVPMAIVNAADRTLYSSAGAVFPGLDGHFTVPPLPPGRWALVARCGETGAAEGTPMLYSGDVEFTIFDQDLSGLVVRCEKGVSVSGRLVVPATASATGSRVRLNLTAVDSLAMFVPGPPPAVIQPDGTFRFEGIGPGKWRVTAALPAGLTLRSALVDGRDTLDTPMEITAGQTIVGLAVIVTDSPTELTGTLSDASGTVTADYSMLAFSTDRALWNSPRRISIQLACRLTDNIELPDCRQATTTSPRSRTLSRCN